MLKIRLQRVGRKHDPAYRIVLTDSRNAAQSGKSVEVLGSYQPRNDKPELKEDRVKHWLGQGVQLSPVMHNMLVDAGLVEGKKKNVLPKKRPIVKEEPASGEAKPEEAKAEAPTASPTEEAGDDKQVQEGAEEAQTQEEAPKQEDDKEAEAGQSQEEPQEEQAKKPDEEKEDSKEDK